MTDIRFYHLKTKTVDEALPALLSKALELKKRILVRVPDKKTADDLNESLWTFDPNSFLPHGTSGNGHESEQPVLLTAENDNLNCSKILFLVNGAEMSDVSGFDLCCEIFDGRDPQALTAARAHWASHMDAGRTLTYWQQTDQGGWEKKGA